MTRKQYTDMMFCHYAFKSFSCRLLEYCNTACNSKRLGPDDAENNQMYILKSTKYSSTEMYG